jgi:pilus assembly protein Flp/PilA
MRRIKHFLWSDDGPTAVEYAVMLAMILLSIIAAIGSVGAEAGGIWGNNQRQLDTFW